MPNVFALISNSSDTRFVWLNIKTEWTNFVPFEWMLNISVCYNLLNLVPVNFKLELRTRKWYEFYNISNIKYRKQEVYTLTAVLNASNGTALA